jgi:hypothetical protein
MSIISDLRDAVYTVIAAKQAATEYAYGNDFTLERTWRPYQLLDQMSADHPTGKVYVIGGTPIGYANLSRTNMVLGEYSVMVGFQRMVTDLNDSAEVDGYTSFVEELEDTCRLEVDPEQFSFTRLEFLRDPDGLPLSFIMLRDAHTFEAYFTVFYNHARRGF